MTDQETIEQTQEETASPAQVAPANSAHGDQSAQNKTQPGEPAQDERNDVAPGRAADTAPASGGSDVHETPPNGAPYDFTRPWTLSNKFNQNLTSIAEAFANQLSFTFSSYLRCTVDVSFRSIKQELFRDHLQSLPENVVMGVVNLPPLHGQSLISVDSQMMFVLLEKLIGGAGRPFTMDRDLTEIETRIFQTVLTRMIGDFKEAARKYFVANGSVSRIETKPSFASVMTPSEKTMTMKLQVSVNEVEGIVLVTVPLIGFDPVMGALDPRDEASITRSDIPPKDREAIHSALNNSSVEVAAVLGESRISLDRLLSLEVGDAVMLEHRVGDPVPIKAGTVILCYGEPGKSQNRKAIRLVSGVETEVTN